VARAIRSGIVARAAPPFYRFLAILADHHPFEAHLWRTVGQQGAKKGQVGEFCTFEMVRRRELPQPILLTSRLRVAYKNLKTASEILPS
jgi:hypothetical protein